MGLVRLAWYVFGVAVVGGFVATLISYAPDVQHLSWVIPTVWGVVAGLAGITAIGLGLIPPTHPIHHSRPVWACAVAAAVMGSRSDLYLLQFPSASSTTNRSPQTSCASSARMASRSVS